ncbi:MAG: hypothetical protein NZ805_00570 [Armatimonadetes bacterium]|nr:hypothetical protein [Armatimonadota bacterium]MDW8027711.1 hypothetical protein [Armatimonadota bacterium]
MLSATPEYAKERLREIQAVVINEVHQFFGTRRGLQLACLLERLKHYTKRPLQRIGLSATVAKPESVAHFLRSSDAPVHIVTVNGRRGLNVYLIKLLVPKQLRFLSRENSKFYLMLLYNVGTLNLRWFSKLI